MTRFATAFGAKILLLCTAMMFHVCPTCAGEPQNRRAMPSRPYMLMYGYSDAMKSLWTESLQYINIITGCTEDFEFVRDLRDRGILFAYHVTPRLDLECHTAEELADCWCRVLENDFNGRLPGGFDAIAVDEIGSEDGTDEAQRICEALRLARSRCPDRRIFVWGTWRMGQGGGQSFRLSPFVTYDEELRAVNEYADLFLYEWYVREGNQQLSEFVSTARNLERRSPGLLAKTLYGLYISQSAPFVADDSPGVDFKDYLDEQFHRFANEPVLQRTAGLAFWCFYRAKLDTIAYINQLIGHYYLQKRQDYFGDGNFSQLVQNPSFERRASWVSTQGKRGLIDVVRYGGKRAIPSAHGSVSHGTSCLHMVRGETPNLVRQRLSLKPDTWYTASGFFYAETHLGQGRIRTVSEALEPLQASSGNNSYWDPWQMPVTTFKTASNGVIWLELTDEEVPEGSSSYWDYVEIEECFGINRPTTIADISFDSRDQQLSIAGENIMPGSLLQIDESGYHPILWQSATRAAVQLQRLPDAGSHRIDILKPSWCLHVHEFHGEFSLATSNMK
jgi:hypothetical protein